LLNPGTRLSTEGNKGTCFSGPMPRMEVENIGEGITHRGGVLTNTSVRLEACFPSRVIKPVKGRDARAGVRWQTCFDY